MSEILVLDTCGSTAYVAVVDGTAGQLRTDRRLGVRSTQEELLPAIADVLQHACLRPADLNAVAVVAGPGSFTGVRIGLATAKGLCEALSIPMTALSRLTILARAAARLPVSAWLDAGRGEVYILRMEDAVRMDNNLSGGALLSRQAALQMATGSCIAVCETSLLDAAPAIVQVSDDAYQAALRAAAFQAISQRKWADTALSDALYLRVPDAELALRARRV